MAYETTDQLLAEMADYWKKTPNSNIYKLFDVFNGSMEHLSDALGTVDDWRQFSNAQGTTLDLVGAGINAHRTSQDDETYRFLITLKYMIAKAQGTYPSIKHIVQTALQTNEKISISQKDEPNHFDVEIPLRATTKFDPKASAQIQRLLAENKQSLPALGFWLDNFKMQLKTMFHLYYGICLGSSESYTINGDFKQIAEAKLEADKPAYYGSFVRQVARYQVS